MQVLEQTGLVKDKQRGEVRISCNPHIHDYILHLRGEDTRRDKWLFAHATRTAQPIIDDITKEFPQLVEGGLQTPENWEPEEDDLIWAWDNNLKRTGKCIFVYTSKHGYHYGVPAGLAEDYKSGKPISPIRWDNIAPLAPLDPVVKYSREGNVHTWEVGA